jgi:hypothetical protein
MILIGNVRYFGQYTSQITAEDITTIANIDLGQQMHILRHFTDVSDEYKSSILGKEYSSYSPVSKSMEPALVTSKDIIEKLSITGSKFLPNNHFSNPDELCHFICNYMLANIHLKFQWYKTSDVNEFCRFYIHLDQPIGTCGVGYKFDLSPTEIASIEVQKRGAGADGYNINTTTVDKLTLTPQLAVTLIKNPESKAFLATAYSGILVPAMPDPSHQGNEELTYNQEYWNNIIVFLKTK